MQSWSVRAREQGRRIGFVPTLGELHEGHLSLMRRVLEESDRLVVSVFVNPTQFGPGEDYENYPRRLGEDLEKLAELGAAICFAPTVEEIYPPGDTTRVEVNWGEDTLCGAARPGHFAGVCNVIVRLFNVVGPHIACFGQKDAQQVLIIRRLVRALHLPVSLILGPTIRENDGLALSSRNAYLSPEERARAVSLHRALEKAGEGLREGERDPARLAALGEGELADGGVDPEYFAVLDPETLSPPARITGGLVLVACAARLGKARLIDNHVYRIGEDGVHETLLF